MNSGDVYRYFGDNCKVIIFDDRDVFFDVLKDGDSVFGNHKTISYYRIPRTFFEENASLLSVGELTLDERNRHRPDLPIRLNCFEKISWSFNPVADTRQLLDILSAHGIKESQLQGLKTDQVVIFPISQQISAKAPKLLKNSDGHFSGPDLLLSCFQLQRAYVKPDKPYFSQFRLIPGGREEKRYYGIGLYRSGLKGGVPSYCIGGVYN